MTDPLQHYNEKYGISVSDIKEVVCGALYCAVMLKNGNIGVCSTLRNDINIELHELSHPDFDNINHRVILNAYFNAFLNYRNKYDKTIDIFKGIDFGSYKNIAMIGLFRPLLKKFRENKINISVFDKLETEPFLISMKDLTKYIKNTDAIILTATSIFNRTFLNIIENSGSKSNIFILGPSSTMDHDMFNYRNIKKIFGTIFEKFDNRVITTINSGHGSRHFLPFGRKVFISNS